MRGFRNKDTRFGLSVALSSFNIYNMLMEQWISSKIEPIFVLLHDFRK
jgi:hypothetical protein